MKFDGVISGCVTEQVSDNNDVDLMLFNYITCLPSLTFSAFKHNSLARIFLSISSHSSSHSSRTRIDMTIHIKKLKVRQRKGQPNHSVTSTHFDSAPYLFSCHNRDVRTPTLSYARLLGCYE